MFLRSKNKKKKMKSGGVYTKSWCEGNIPRRDANFLHSVPIPAFPYTLPSLPPLSHPLSTPNPCHDLEKHPFSLVNVVGQFHIQLSWFLSLSS